MLKEKKKKLIAKLVLKSIDTRISDGLSPLNNPLVVQGFIGGRHIPLDNPMGGATYSPGQPGGCHTSTAHI